MASRRRQHSRFSVAYLSVVEFAKSPTIMTHGGLKAARRVSTDSKVQKDREELQVALSDIYEQAQLPLVAERNQQTSPFLSKLPAELREAVYGYYYGGAVLTIREVFLHLDLRYAAFMEDSDALCSPSEARDPRTVCRVRKGLLDLPRTCRQMYADNTCTTLKFER